MLLAGLLRRFATDADTLLRALLIPYADFLRSARTSFRPAEIAGRAYSPRHDDRRLHVDAFPSRPLRGAGFYELFTNLSPVGRHGNGAWVSRSRRWPPAHAPPAAAFAGSHTTVRDCLA